MAGIVAALAPRMAVTPCMPMMAAPAIADTTKDFMLAKFVLLNESAAWSAHHLTLMPIESIQDDEENSTAMTESFVQNTMAGKEEAEQAMGPELIDMIGRRVTCNDETQLEDVCSRKTVVVPYARKLDCENIRIQ